LGQLAVARLELGKQSDVLNGDDGLVGEGLEKCDLALQESPGVYPDHVDRAYRLSTAEHRDSENSPGSSPP
jgi:hypothetical protein